MDAFGGLSGEAARVADAYAAWQQADAERARHEAEIAATRANADYVSHALEELRSLDPQAGEEESSGRAPATDDACREDRRRARRGARCACTGRGPSGARLAAALRRIERQASVAPQLLAPVAEALERVLTETNTARAKIEEALALSAFEPKELERAEERLFALRALARKHRVAVDDLPALLDRLEAELAALDTSEARAGELAKRAAAARKDYEIRSRRPEQGAASRPPSASTTKSWASSAPSSSKERASSPISRPSSLAEGGPSGIDRIAFFVRTNPGTEAGPLMKVASGGELARFILALKVVLAARGSAPTLVFDEADAGVGGATAAAVGERLARLAARVQVLAVTHAPQVAAVAHRPSADRQGGGARVPRARPW